MAKWRWARAQPLREFIEAAVSLPSTQSRSLLRDLDLQPIQLLWSLFECLRAPGSVIALKWDGGRTDGRWPCTVLHHALERYCEDLPRPCISHDGDWRSADGETLAAVEQILGEHRERGDSVMLQCLQPPSSGPSFTLWLSSSEEFEASSLALLFERALDSIAN